MTISVPGNFNVVVLIVLVVLLVFLVMSIMRRPTPAEWSTARILYGIAFFCFLLAALGIAQFPWLPIGLACWVGAILAS